MLFLMYHEAVVLQRLVLPMLAPVPVAEGSSETTTERNWKHIILLHGTDSRGLPPDPVDIRDNLVMSQCISDTNITIDSLDICYNRDQDDHDDTDDLDQERDLLASLIQKLKCKIVDNKFLESSNKALVDKLKVLQKPEFLKKAQRANPRLYDIGCYNDNLTLLLAPESDETIRLDKEIRSKLSDLIKPFDYDQLNNLYDLFVP
ncbi:hypothetical protein Tco_0609305 [Tanacetum coccineum]